MWWNPGRFCVVAIPSKWRRATRGVCRVSGLFRGVLLVAGGMIALCGIAAVVTALVEVSTGGDGKTTPGVYAGLIVFFGGVGAVGVYMIWQALQGRVTVGCLGEWKPLGVWPIPPRSSWVRPCHS